jgi:hypothetical protein
LNEWMNADEYKPHKRPFPPIKRLSQSHQRQAPASTLGTRGRPHSVQNNLRR